MNARNTLKANTNGVLEIGGVSATELRNTYGTPLYVMDVAHIEKLCACFAQTLKNEYGEGLITYASKAFCCKEIYRILQSFGLGADSVSLGEMLTAKSVDFPFEKICLHGNNKTQEELDFAIKNNVGFIVIDCLQEIDIIEDICAKHGKIQNVLIRVNPGVEAHTHEYIQTAKTDSKFGFSISDGTADKVISLINKNQHLNLKGLHCHIGSQIFEKQSFVLAVEKMTNYYALLNNKGIEFDTLDLGGGFGIWYTDEDEKLSVQDYAQYIKTITDALKKCVAQKKLKKPYLILEPGRAIVGESGITLYTVGGIKEITGVKNYISIDGGMFDNPRFALYQAKYSVVAAQKMNDAPLNTYSIAGKCCESGDIIANDVKLPEVKMGDLLAVLSTGAYNYSMASNYNRNLIPAVVGVKDGNSYYMVKPQTYDDLLKNDI